ncbi:VWA domain-containing protein [candidate division KSB1 bacterium]|nr:VWA domain-containing protein [candidate division KSB1 bacterium]
MRIQYTQWTGKELSDLHFDDLLNMFNQLLLKLSGDVGETLKWMQRMNEEYGIFKHGVDFDDFLDQLEQKGFIKRNKDRFSLTSKGNQKIRQDSLKQIFNSLKPGVHGNHLIPNSGRDIEKTNDTRPYVFGDNISNLDVTGSLSNALRNHGIDDFKMQEEDLISYETEDSVSCATVLLVDISHSMILYGEDRITPAKQVALALSELIMTQFPRDRLNVAVFGDTAKEIEVADLPFLKVGPFHTNTKAGLRLGRDLLNREKTANKQIFMITDGKPSAIFNRGKLYKNSWGLDPLIVNQTLNEAAACRKEKIVISTFMIARDPYLQNFVEKLTRVNQGRAFFASLDNLSEFIFVDYIRNRKRKLH